MMPEGEYPSAPLNILPFLSIPTRFFASCKK